MSRGSIWLTVRWAVQGWSSASESPQGFLVHWSIESWEPLDLASNRHHLSQPRIGTLQELEVVQEREFLAATIGPATARQIIIGCQNIHLTLDTSSRTGKACAPPWVPWHGHHPQYRTPAPGRQLALGFGHFSIHRCFGCGYLCPQKQE